MKIISFSWRVDVAWESMTGFIVIQAATPGRVRLLGVTDGLWCPGWKFTQPASKRASTWERRGMHGHPNCSRVSGPQWASSRDLKAATQHGGLARWPSLCLIFFLPHIQLFLQFRRLGKRGTCQPSESQRHSTSVPVDPSVIAERSEGQVVMNSLIGEGKGKKDKECISLHEAATWTVFTTRPPSWGVVLPWQPKWNHERWTMVFAFPVLWSLYRVISGFPSIHTHYSTYRDCSSKP